MGQRNGFNHKNDVRHLPGGDTSLRKMYASHGVPVKASTNGRSKNFAITTAQRQWSKRVWRSNNSFVVINVRGLGDKDRPTSSNMFRNGTSFQQIL